MNSEGDHMKLRMKLDRNRYETMLKDLDKMYEKGEVSSETYQEMKKKYEEKLKELEELHSEEEGELELEFEELGEELENLGERISLKVEKAVSKAMQNVQKIGGQIPNSFDYGEYFTAEDVHEGSFDTDHVTIDFATFNGRIDLKTWEKDTYEVVVTKKVRSHSAERAQERLDAIRANFEHQKNGQDVLKLHVSEKEDAVSISGSFPRTVKGGLISKDHPIIYDLNLKSVNGRIATNGMDTGEATLETVNGRIEIGKIRSHNLVAQTVNGRVSLEDTEMETGDISTENGRAELINTSGKTVTASTENGSLRGRISFEHAELKTENGSLRISPQGAGEYQLRTDVGSIKITIERDIPYEIDARTSMGKIAVAPDLEVFSKEKHHISLKSTNLDEAEEKLSITARTDIGSIKIM
jgi:DUF4097 and DUF4098 domain-containing protein YvlB